MAPAKGVTFEGHAVPSRANPGQAKVTLISRQGHHNILVSTRGPPH